MIRGRATPPRSLKLTGQHWRIGGGAPESDRVVRTRSAMRVLWTGGFIGAGYVMLGLQAGSLMLFPDDQLAHKARVQFERSVEVRGRRGSILDRDGHTLATSVTLYSLHADPSRLDPSGVGSLAAELAPLIDADEGWLRARLSRSERRNVLLARGLSPGEADDLTGRRARGVLYANAEETRFYPGRSDAVHVLGTVGRNGRGSSGLEATLDRELLGEVVKYVEWRDRKGRAITMRAPTADSGNDIVVTLDRAIQHAAEEALDAAMERTRAEAAHVVVMDVATGDILAMANRPSDNPNDTRTLEMGNLKNRAALDAFEPGSVFKPFMAAAVLDQGALEPDSIVDCEGGAWLVGRNVISDDHPKGEITLTEVIKYSSNIGAAKLAFELGPEKTLEYMSDFGFGRPTELGIPGETSGYLRSSKNIRPIELATISYGHGVSASGVQLAAAVAALGNDGVRMKPRLIKEIRNPRGEVIASEPPQEDRRVVDSETARQVVDMMVTVIEKGGTGTRAAVDGYTVAGKTGTAWKHENGHYSATDRIGSFVGLIPAEAPRLAISVSVDTPTQGSSYGGIVAAPVFADVARDAMRILGVPPTVEPEVDEADPALVAEAPLPIPMVGPELVEIDEATWKSPDLTGLSFRDALAVLQGSGLGLAANGTGRIVAQDPLPGTVLPKGHRVEVVLQ